MTPKLSLFGRAALTLGSATVALANPARADLIAMLGDLTGSPVLPLLRSRIAKTQEGREMLATLHPPRFPEHGSASLPALRELPPGSLGREYAHFMDVRKFTPESRDEVRFVDDLTDAWVMQRYRDVHDLWHVLTGMPTTVMGELAQKWFEAAQTGLPVAVLSAVVGPLRLPPKQRQVLVRELVPWAVTCGMGATDLLAIRYEDRMGEDVEALRREWGITVPDLIMRKR